MRRCFMKGSQLIRLNQPINSQKLCDSLEPTYKALFNRCRCVCSAPGVFFWAGEHAVIGGAIATCQAFPQRVWVGLEPSYDREQEREMEIEIDTHLLLDMTVSPPEFKLADAHEWDGSVSRDVPRQRKEALIAEIKKMCRIEGLERCSFRIHTVSEFRPKFGGNWSGAFSTALAAAILVLNDRLKERDIDNWRNQPGWSLCKDATFRTVNRWAWHFDTLFHAGSASGYGSAASLVGGEWPLTFFAEERHLVGDPPFNFISGQQGPYSWDSDDTWLEHINYSIFRFTDIFGDKISPPPLICGLICSGVKKNTGKRIEMGRSLNVFLENARTNLSLLLENHREVMGGVDTERCAFLPLLKENGDALLGKYYEALSVGCVETNHAVARVFTGHCEDSDFKHLARVLTSVQGSLMQLAQNWPMGELLLGTVLLTGEQEGIGERTAAKLTGGGGGGFLLFVAPQPSDREESFEAQLLKRLESINAEWDATNVYAQWLSDVDGFETQGLRIEMGNTGRNCHHPWFPNGVATKPSPVEIWTYDPRDGGAMVCDVRDYAYEYEIEHLKHSPNAVVVDMRSSLKIDPERILLCGQPYSKLKPAPQSARQAARILSTLLDNTGDTPCMRTYEEIGEPGAQLIKAYIGELIEHARKLGITIEIIRAAQHIRLKSLSPGCKIVLIEK
jgi:mevalonate kinase/rhodanese-related sulfurtransferase